MKTRTLALLAGAAGLCLGAAAALAETGCSTCAPPDRCKDVCGVCDFTKHPSGCTCTASGACVGTTAENQPLF